MTNKQIWRAWMKRYHRPPTMIIRWYDGRRMVIEIVDEPPRSPLWSWM
jgi:hypothetical protein